MEATMETTDERMRMFSPSQIAQIERMSEEIKKRLAPRGSLGLPELLDARRLEWGITDGAFEHQAAYDRILVHQIPMAHFMDGKYAGPGGLIVMPDNQAKARERSAPRGIIVSAGLKALDELRTNGMDLGHIITFNEVSPWRIETDVVGGKLQHLLVMHAGHIISSEDTRKRLLRRELFVDGPVTEHVYVNRGTGDRSAPVLPAMMTSEEY